MKAATRRSETALVRPYADLSSAETVLDSLRLTVDLEEHEQGAITLPPEILKSAQFGLIIPSPELVRDAIRSTPVPYVDCGLVILATSRSHRLSIVLLQQYLRTADWPEKFTLDRQRADMVLNDRDGFTLTVAVVLLNDLTPAPLRPYMAGTWLARGEFRVSPEASDTNFSPLELTDEVKETFELPKATLRYIEVNEALFEEQISDAVQIYVDPEILHLLFQTPQDPFALQFQAELAILTTKAVAFSIASDLSYDSVLTADALSNYPSAYQFYENLARRLELTIDYLLELAGDRSPVLRAHLEDSFGVRSVTAQALKDR